MLHHAGLAECIENEVFTTLKCNLGWCGALMNVIGGVFFLVGSVLSCFDDAAIAYWADFSYGVGSVVFAVESAGMLIMWQDEQFGLTFCAALNNLGGPHGRPLVLAASLSPGAPMVEVEEKATFSWRVAFFIILYIFAATVSVYTFVCSLADISIGQNFARATYLAERSFNALLPCIFVHTLLGLSSAVIKPPKTKPCRELYIGCSFLAVLMIVIGTAHLVEKLMGHGNVLCGGPVGTPDLIVQLSV